MPAVMTPARAGARKGGMRPNLPFRVNLAAWYRYRMGVTNINGAASAWADLSGNMRALTQATVANRPAILSDGSLLFNGTTHALAAAFTLSQPLTLYMAFQQISWTSGDVILDGSTGTVKVSQATGSPGLTANAGSSLANSTTLGLNAPGVICFVANSTSSVYQVGAGAATVTTTGDASTNNAGGLTLGADRSAANNANIRVYELIAYSVAHDAAQRLQVMRYLGRTAQVGGI